MRSSAGLIDALGLIPRIIVLPHHREEHNPTSYSWHDNSESTVILGIEEATGCVSTDGILWQVLGEGSVRVYSGLDIRRYKSDQQFELL